MSKYRKQAIKEHYDLDCNTLYFDLDKYSQSREEALEEAVRTGGISIYHIILRVSFIIPYETRADFQKFLLSGDEKDIPENYETSVDAYRRIVFIPKQHEFTQK